jgi:lysophospholipase L1-like esterase
MHHSSIPGYRSGGSHMIRLAVQRFNAGRLLTLLALVAIPANASLAQDQKGPTADLVWYRTQVNEGTATGWFRCSLDPVIATGDRADLLLSTNAHCSLYVNGQRILKNHAPEESSDSRVLAFNIHSLLRQGRNSVAIEINSDDKTAAFGIGLVRSAGNERTAVGGVWKTAPAPPPVGWQQTDFNDRDWNEVKAFVLEPAVLVSYPEESQFRAAVVPAKSRVAPFQFEDGDRIVLVGATFFERAQLFEHLEATLAGTLGSKHVTFRNLGWSADTASADSRGIFDKPEVGYLRMVEHIRAEEPTVALICYGQNEALAEDTTPEQFAAQLGKLIDELDASGITCVVVSPHELLNAKQPLPSPSRFNNRIRIYSEAAQSVAQSRGLIFVDVFANFADRIREMSQHLTTDHSSGDSESDAKLAENGMHFTDLGYAAASLVFREALLGMSTESPQVTVNVTRKSLDARHATTRNVQWNPDGKTLVRFEVREDVLAPLPLIVRADKLTTGSENVNLSIDDGDQKSQLEGQKLEAPDSRQFVVGTNPQYEALRQLLLRKNELYFHRWRPQNITYLFGFRKHEQGNNAADIARFDPFIQDLEQQIHATQEPQWRTMEITIAK